MKKKKKMRTKMMIQTMKADDAGDEDDVALVEEIRTKTTKMIRTNEEAGLLVFLRRTKPASLHY